MGAIWAESGRFSSQKPKIDDFSRFVPKTTRNWTISDQTWSKYGQMRVSTGTDFATTRSLRAALFLPCNAAIMATDAAIAGADLVEGAR